MLKKKSIFIVSIFLCLVSTVTGQNSATANFTASVTIIEPVSIKTTSNMNFAEINAGTGGTVTLNPDNSRQANGGVELKPGGLTTAAEFEIKGQQGHAYDLQIPSGIYSMSNGANEIIIRDFALSELPQHLEEDTQKIRLGATLEIPANQKPGRYVTPTPLEITISYN
ncbi:DUF4402 domain-containing protein [Christiangramia sabulilitoris]|uniref:DUF4402 domain-containing protein n=1 Tax=Christiangramia sabulilitoris TaxID=2583991 RepID=A0A550I6B1_9FLAO|nr:DUF4402 domain-containing protein [Christiangramia sabulilitoris]TRO66510.1 DUF4402 domain-containing protein [Christiangramia sabulilitoris]